MCTQNSIKERDCESVQRTVNRWLSAEGILIRLTCRLFRLRIRQDKLVKLIMFDALTAWLEFMNTAVAVRTSDIVSRVAKRRICPYKCLNKIYDMYSF